MKRENEVARLCPTLRDPMDYSLPGSSIHGIFQARVLEWGTIAFSLSSLGSAKSADSVNSKTVGVMSRKSDTHTKVLFTMPNLLGVYFFFFHFLEDFMYCWSDLYLESMGDPT